MANYYFLVVSFPPLVLGNRPELSFKELKDLLVLNLTAADLKKVEQLLMPIDLYNIRALWLGLPIDERGNYEAKELEEALLVREGLPQYLLDYLDRYETTAERLRYFSSLYVSLFREQQPKLKGFLLQFYQMERETRLILAALRAKKFGKDIVRELQFEDPTDPLVADIIAQKDAPDYQPPREYEALKALFGDNYSEPQKLQRAILQYRFEELNEMKVAQDFGIDRVLVYITRLLIAESYADEQDREKGLEQLSKYE